MSFALPSQSQEIVNSWPGRLSQIETLELLLNPTIPPAGVLHIYGRPATGKTGTVLAVLRHQRIKYSLVDSNSLRGVHNLLSGVARDALVPRSESDCPFGSSLTEVDLSDISRFADLGRILQNSPALRPNEPFVIVVKAAPLLARACNDPHVYTNLVRLSELAQRPVPIVLITTGIWPGLESIIKSSPPLQIAFPAYKERDLERILHQRMVLRNDNVEDLLLTRLSVSNSAVASIISTFRFIKGQQLAKESNGEQDTKEITAGTCDEVPGNEIRLLDVVDSSALQLFTAYVVGVVYHSTRDLLEIEQSLRSLSAVLIIVSLANCVRNEPGISTCLTLPIRSLPPRVLAEMRSSSRDAVKNVMFHELPMPAPECLKSTIIPFMRSHESELKAEESSCQKKPEHCGGEASSLLSANPISTLTQLPLMMRYIIFAATLAAYCRTTDDSRIFSNEPGTKRRRRNQSVNAQNTQGIASGAPLPTTLTSGRSFNLERLLTIFAAISDAIVYGSQGEPQQNSKQTSMVTENQHYLLSELNIAPSIPFGIGKTLLTPDSPYDGPSGVPYDALISKIGSLISIGALTWTTIKSRDDPLQDGRLMCTLPLDDVRKLAELSGFNIDVYLPS